MRQDLYPELFEVEDSHWWHQHKRQIVHKLIKVFADKKGRVLDIGAGTGRILSELKQMGWQVKGIDTEKQAAKQSQKREIELKLIDIDKQILPFKANSFEVVLCLDSLEHLTNEVKVLKEIIRVTKPGGIIILTVPAYQWLYSYWDKMLGHKKRYSKNKAHLGEIVKLRVSGDKLTIASAHMLAKHDKCARIHGHNYFIEVEIEGELNEENMIIKC